MNREIVKSFIKMLLPALAAITAIICAIYGFGWFSMSHQVAASGKNIHTKDVGVLEIRELPDGIDISAETVEGIEYRLPINKKLTKLCPTASGNFTFYVYDSSSEAQIPYSFLFRLSVENDRTCENEGFYPNTDAEERELAKQYINSHLLFFKEYDEEAKRYKGWMKSGELMRCTAEENPKEITVYWVWVDQYKQIFEENSVLIDEETRKSIASYYETNPELILADGAGNAEDYNVADTLIGMTIKDVCFLIDVVKD
ncbi:MAG: hypothetical protein PUC29_04430 [Clostridia bacterium]|nr:hypothetical protein [Clostridia bacterium]